MDIPHLPCKVWMYSGRQIDWAYQQVSLSWSATVRNGSDLEDQDEEEEDEDEEEEEEQDEEEQEEQWMESQWWTYPSILAPAQSTRQAESTEPASESIRVNLQKIEAGQSCRRIVIATGTNRRVSFGCGYDPELNCCNGSYHTTTRTVAIGPVLPPKTQHFSITSLAGIRFLSSDRMVTWSICRLCSFMRSITSQLQICDPTKIRWVMIESTRFSPHISPSFTPIQRILVGLQIWMWEVKERVKLNNLRIDHVTMRSQLRYLIGARVESEWKQP